MCDTKNLTIFQKLNKVRLEFMKKPIEKSGKNKFAGFNYYELKDIIPTAIELLDKYNLCFVISFNEDDATAILIDSDTEKTIEFKTHVEKLDVRAKGMNSAQARGAVETYARRRLWSSLLELTDGEVVDTISVGAKGVESVEQNVKPKQPAQQTASNTPSNNSVISTREEYTFATDDDVKAVKEKLKSFKNAGGEPEYIKNVLKELKATNLSKDYCDVVIEDIDRRMKGGK